MAVPQHIFIDTSEWEELGFGKDKLLEHLMMHIEGGRVVLHTTSLTIKEVRERVRRVTDQYDREHRQAANTGAKVGLQPAIRNPINTDSIVAEFEEFLRRASALVHDLVNIDLGEIVRRRFAYEPPFSSSKRNEWEDALAGFALHAWAVENQLKIIVISKDGDWGAMGKALETLEIQRLAQVISEAERERAEESEAEQDFLDKLYENLSRNRGVLEHRIKLAFEGLEGIVDDRIEDEAEVEGIYVGRLVLAIEEAAVVYADLETGYGEISVPGEVRLRADATYGDDGSMIWNSEDGVGWYDDVVKRSIEENMSFEVMCEVQLEGDEFEIVQVDIGARILLVSVHDEESGGSLRLLNR